jgi:SNF2 family DNA or RNA helicase
MKVLKHQASLKNGIAIHHEQEIPSVKKAQAELKAILDDVKAVHTVHPTKVTHQNLKSATKQYNQAMLGLRIAMTNPNAGAHVLLGPTRGPCRSWNQSSARGYREDFASTILESTGDLEKHVLLLEEEREKMTRYQRATEIPEEVRQNSAYETLVALSENDFAHTWCPICMDHLGATKLNHTQSKSGIISLTHCGHLYCQLCLDNYVSARRLAHQQTPCPTCRKSLDVADGVIAVDPNLSSELDDMKQKRLEAKQIIQQASKMLETSNGQLEAAMWEQLYLSIDLPTDVSTAGEPRLTAIPREVLQHLRAATGMETHCKSHEIPPNGLNGETRNSLSSKIQALLAEIPKDERCVIFSGSIGAIKHLTFCFRKLDMPHQAIYTGQNVNAQEHALAAWKSSTINILDGNSFIPFPILVVQSGAAASGLTLTDACKIFLLEPFSRQEEEQQAYARCHRYGQINPVHVKVFYTPVSVESRLLEWRKKAGQYQADNNVTTKYASLDGMEEDDDDEQLPMNHGMAKEDEYTNQTLFLLGLIK